MRFGIITPTIGRSTLRRCCESLEHQVYRDFFHIVVGDGPQDAKVKEWAGEHYYETPAKEGKGCFGAAPRNLAIELLENDPKFKCDYVIFLDDDNVLLEPALYQARITAVTRGQPKLMYQDIVFTCKFNDFYEIFPRDQNNLANNGDWDLLNGIYRRDVINGVRFQKEYVNDLYFTQDVLAKLDASERQWIKVKGIGGIHHLSWDTFDG